MFLGLNLLFLFVFRVPLAFLIRHSFISRTSIFYSLIGIPCLVLFHAVFAGLVCKYLVYIYTYVRKYIIFLFADFSFEYLSLLAGVVAFAVISVRAQRKKKVEF